MSVTKKDLQDLMEEIEELEDSTSDLKTKVQDLIDDYDGE